jgi:hypothetical protein
MTTTTPATGTATAPAAPVAEKAKKPRKERTPEQMAKMKTAKEAKAKEIVAIKAELVAKNKQLMVAAGMKETDPTFKALLEVYAESEQIAKKALEVFAERHPTARKPKRPVDDRFVASIKAIIAKYVEKHKFDAPKVAALLTKAVNSK